MKKILLLCLSFFLYTLGKAQGSCDAFFNDFIKFSGVAPAPWAINGQFNDWATILGPYSGNNVTPYSPPPAANWAYDHSAGNPDKDTPPAGIDLNFMAFTQDSYNAYFYFRRKVVTSDPYSFYYFLDVNADGHMQAGEPVVGANINTTERTRLTLYRFVPNTGVDYEGSVAGNWMVNDAGKFSDGYTIKGSLQVVASPTALGPNEKFAMAQSINGDGIELSVPFKYLRNWLTMSPPLAPNLIFSYHLALQNPTGIYNPALVKDNGGNCCGRLSITGSPILNPGSTTVTALVPGSSYRVKMVLQNPLNVEQVAYFNAISFKNIQVYSGMSFQPTDFTVTVYPDNNANGIIDPGEDPYTYDYATGSFASQPIFYNKIHGVATVVQPFANTGFIIDFTLPANNSISNLSVDLHPSVTLSGFISFNYCFALSGGGKPINPVGFELTPDPDPDPDSRNQSGENRTTTENKKMLIYPNPSQGTVNIRLPDNRKNSELLIEDISGKTIYRKQVSAENLIVVKNLLPGIYIIRNNPTEPGQKPEIRKLIVH